MKIAKILGIEVSLHWSFLLILGWFTFASVFGPPLISLIIALILFGIILLHEFGHALMGKLVGYKADKININMLGGIAFVDSEEKQSNLKWWKEFLVIFFGPLVNILILIFMPIIGTFLEYNNAEIFYKILQGPTPDYNMINVFGTTEYIFHYVFFLNLILLVFNMLPIYPLDGGQILHSLFWGILKLFGIKRARSVSGYLCSILGLFGAASLFIFGIMNGAIIIALIAMFIGFYSLASNIKYSEDYKNGLVA